MCWIVVSVILLSMAVAVPMFAHAQAPAGGSVAPVKEAVGRVDDYIDLRAGFRVRLPVGLERTDMRSASQMVSWSQRDAKTGAIVWTLSVNSMRAAGGGPMQKQMDDIVATLKDKENFEIESAKLVKVGPDEAIDLQGTATLDATGKTAGKIQWWQRQVWVRHDDKFLTWRITGPAQAREEMNGVMAGVLKSLALIDAKQALAEREKNLKAGAVWLVRLKEMDVGKRLKPASEQWFTITQDDKPVGWAVMTFAVEGKSVTTRLTLCTESAEIDGSTSAALDRSEAVGTLRVRNALDRSWQTIEQSELAKETLTVIEAAAGGRSRTREKSVPTATFLPTALVQAIPLLVDRDKPATLSFAVNAPRDPQLDVCTVRVGVKRDVILDGKRVQAVPVEVQQAEDAGADVFWIGPEGTMLRVESSSGFRMTLSTQSAVLKTFPDAKVE